MEKEITYNLDQLIKIIVRNKRIKDYWKYIPERRTRILHKIIPAHFKDISVFAYQGRFSKEELINRGYLIDDKNQVFDTPDVRLFFCNNHEHSRDFLTFKEAKDWAQDNIIKNMKNPITIILED